MIFVRYLQRHRCVQQIRYYAHHMLLAGLACMVPTAHVTAGSTDQIFAEVNGEKVLLATYRAALRSGGRQRFYHGTPPEAEIIAFRKEIGDQLVTDRLLHQEALRLGVMPDHDWVDKELERIVNRYSRISNWEQERENLLPLLRSGLEERSRITQLQAQARTAQPPIDEELRAFYQDNAEAFTSPEQVRVSIILLKVDPWASPEGWEQRKREAETIHKQLLQGTDFGELARRHSDDDTAGQGGDMGYLHKGMLGSQAQEVIDNLQPGEIAAPAMLLEGVAIFYLEDRISPHLNPLDKVRGRAETLWLREAKKRAYSAFVQSLRDRSEVTFSDPSYFLITQK